MHRIFKQRKILRPPLSILLALAASANSAANAETEAKSIVREVQQAMVCSQPIYDVAYIGRRMAKQWFPPKDGGPSTWTFGFDADGKVSQLQLSKSSGSKVCDMSSAAAIEKASIVPVPLGAARISCRFNYLMFNDAHAATDVLITEGAEAPPVVFVNSGKITPPRTLAAIEENDRGVGELLKGAFANAKMHFESSLKVDSQYVPARHNLNLAKESWTPSRLKLGPDN